MGVQVHRINQRECLVLFYTQSHGLVGFWSWMGDVSGKKHDVLSFSLEVVSALYRTNYGEGAIFHLEPMVP